jgi:non-homologous end joining protein Ku
VAPARPYWKGYLRLSLVSCPIAVYIESTHTIDIDSFYRATTSTSAISFASPVQVEVRSVRGVRVQRCGNVGKTAK